MVSADASDKDGNSSDFIQGPTIPEDGKAQSIYIIHFNDVYNVDEMNGEGGAPRFKTAVKSFANKDPLILFSGDILAPSIMSSFTHGEQMIPVLNQLDVHCAVFGNHDFDFGLERLVEVKEQTKFPWLMSNVVDNETDKPLADGHVFKIFLWKGWKIGLIGLVEEEWLCTLATINMDEVTYTDFVDRGRELASQLKNEGCDYVIALTHMRTPNDIRLAENVDEIDLILGGHDHVYEISEVNGKYVLKSGTDFREFSLLTLTAESKNVNVDIEKIEISTKFLPDEELTESLEKFSSTVNEKMEEELGTFSVDLDGRFSSIRTSETNLGNFICDILLAACNGDVTLLNSGTLRSDRIHPAGKFTMRDLTNILPMLDSLCVLEVTGKKLLAALENGVSQYPKLEGRFPQVAGIQFAFNPNSPPGERIYKDVVKIGDEYVDEEATYRLVTKAYMRHGKDGYDMLVGLPCSEKENDAFCTARKYFIYFYILEFICQDDEQCPMLSTAVQNHFHAIQSKLGKTTRRNSTHRQSLLLLSRRHSLIRSDDEHPSPLHPHVPHGTRTQPSRPPPRHSIVKE
ncbi:Trifunctional nucleotide phosphoesterase protein YfkN [Armadillidium nasatum]|uniref:Trifunctional nucleotide phosphoesterase protein YfkN n=1 Tax=Armadillidium nasatum TaxID=96803 RepID=A0A5N5SZ57_9CRUS|nr:Trifunctional nucleotide phosphoesterase protein YfkN [Armadillidium nasatum]